MKQTARLCLLASFFGFAILDVSQAQVDVQSDGTVKIGNLAKVRIGICQPDGREVSLHSLTELQCELVLKAGELKPGMYLYSLIVAGQVQDTKRMVVTR